MTEIEKLIANAPLPGASGKLDARVDTLFRNHTQQPADDAKAAAPVSTRTSSQPWLWKAAALGAALSIAGVAVVGVAAGYVFSRRVAVPVRPAVASNRTDPASQPAITPGAAAVQVGSPAGVYRTHFACAAASNAPVIVATGHKEPLELGAYMPYNRAGDTLHVWDWSKSSKSRCFPGVRLWPTGKFAVSPDGKYLVWSDGRVLDLQTGKHLKKIDLGGDLYPSDSINIDRIRNLKFLPYGGLLAVSINDVRVKPSRHPLRSQEIDNRITTQLIHFRTGDKACELPTGSNCACTPIPKHVVAAAPQQKSSQQLVEYAIDGGTVARTFAPPLPDHAYAVEASPCGRFIAAHVGKGGLMIWNAKTAQLLHKIDRVKDVSYTSVMQFSPDGQYLALSGIPTVAVVDVPRGVLVASIKSCPAAQIRWSQDLKTLTVITGKLHYEGGPAGIYSKLMAVQKWDWRNNRLIQAFDCAPPS